MLFGSYADGVGPATPLEAETSETMQDFVLSFMKDPYNGPKKMGWFPNDPTAPDGGSMLRFGADGKAVQNVTGYEVQSICLGEGVYEPFP